mgnify:CR=1 FL=1
MEALGNAAGSVLAVLPALAGMVIGQRIRSLASEETFRRWLALPMGLTALALLWLCWRLGGQTFLIASASIALTLLFVLRATGQAQRRGIAARGVLNFGLLPLVDSAVFSSGVGWRKPSPRIFAAALEALHAEPATTVMVLS